MAGSGPGPAYLEPDSQSFEDTDSKTPHPFIWLQHHGSCAEEKLHPEVLPGLCIKSAFVISCSRPVRSHAGRYGPCDQGPTETRKRGAVVVILSWWLSQGLTRSSFELDPKPILWEL